MKLALESGVGAPDVFTGEIAFLKQWIDTGYWENLSEEPYNAEEVSKDIVPYIFDLGKDKDGNVCAISWQTTPGGIYYKRSIAKEALGTDDPAKVGEMMSSMDELFEVGEKLKSKGYKLFPDEGSIRWFAQGDDSQAGGNEDTELVLTEGKQNYFDNPKELRENNLTALAPEWLPSWFEGMDKLIKVKEGGKETETEVFSYVRQHLEAVSDLNDEGMNIQSYYLWSLMDNFEWCFGYEKRFGILYIDFETKGRIWKDSAKWYADVIADRKAKHTDSAEA